MSALLPALLHGVLVLVLPVLLVGVVNRTKARWAGRQGPALLQSGWDLWRLLRKQPVYSTVVTPLFRAGAYGVLLAALLGALVAPLLGAYAPLQFAHDFVLFAYTMGLSRLFLMLSAMEVGSAFEGMGAAREASFAAYSEPALFLLLGSLGIATGQTSFASLVGQFQTSPVFPWLVVPVIGVLFILLQSEASRVPVDDPLTHLELTMVHEVMVLDHSGPELAALQYAGALKLCTYAGLIAALLSPLAPLEQPFAAAFATLLLTVLVAVAVGCVESLMARLRMRQVPRYLLLASLLACLCLAGASAWSR
ncbi:MAG: NADH-quinone oxidoreductase subunit H [Rhodoferax sp.]